MFPKKKAPVAAPPVEASVALSPYFVHNPDLITVVARPLRPWEKKNEKS